MVYKALRRFYHIYRHRKHTIGGFGAGITIITTRVEIYTLRVIGITGQRMNTITTIMDLVVTRITPYIIIKGGCRPLSNPLHENQIGSIDVLLT